ncbi:MAG: FAD-dependent oxidoreductase, partial [Planctomycetota bacterium]
MTPTAESPAEPTRWAVVGGGVLGLRLAQRLAAAGQRVTVFEAAPQIGGLASEWTLETDCGQPITWDKHYHVTLLSDLRLRELLGDLGLTDDLRWVETKTGFYTDGRLHSMSNSIEFLRFPPLGLIDKLRLAATIFYGSKITDPKPLEQVLVGDWLRKWSGRRTFEKIWEPLLLAKLGDAYRRTSAAFIWATIDRMYRARQSGMKKELFGYVSGGYARVLGRYAERLADAGVELVTGSSVHSVRSPGDTAGDPVEVVTDSGTRSFDRVVLTTPSDVVDRLCPGLGADQRQRHRAIEYLGVVCASVVLDEPISSYYVTNITDRGAPFTAVIEMTAMVDPAELGGRRLVYLPRYASPDDPIWRR